MWLIKRIYGFFYQSYLKIVARYTSGWQVYYSAKLKLYFLLNKSHFIDFLLYRNGVFEPQLLQSIETLIVQHEIKLFIDIGSHIGQMSLYVAKKYPAIKILSFEAFYPNFVRQEMNKLLNQIDYQLYHQAISSQKEERNIFIPQTLPQEDYGKFNTGMVSFYADKWRENLYSTVFCSPLDDFMLNLDPSLPVLIKIDVEGAELEVLQGMTLTLQRFEKIILIIELLFVRMPEKSLKVYQLLAQLGWQMFSLTQNPIKDIQNLKDNDFIFLRTLPHCI